MKEGRNEFRKRIRTTLKSSRRIKTDLVQEIQSDPYLVVNNTSDSGTKCDRKYSGTRALMRYREHSNKAKIMWREIVSA